MAQAFLVRAGAWLLEATGGVAGLRAASRTLLGWVQEVGGHTAAYLAGLPRECKLAMRHTLLICSGEKPVYYTVPVFGPVGLAFGWLILGLLIGCVLGTLFCVVLGRKTPSVL